MSELTGWIEEIFYTPGGTGMTIECSSAVQVQPGQYLHAYAPALQEILPTALFVQQKINQQLVIAPSIPALWQPGFELKLRGPLGCGFNPPSGIQHLALADFSSRTGLRLISLASPILSNGGEVVLLSDTPPDTLPAAIELLPLKSLPEAFTWADYMAVDLHSSQLSNLKQSITLEYLEHQAKPVEVLIDLPLLCGGNGSCGICSVYADHKWKFACKDGPVFPISSLQEEE